MKLLRNIRIRSSYILPLLAVAGVLVPSEGKPTSTPTVKFEVLSVRVLNSQEAAARSPDFLGPNVAVRLRLSAPNGIYFLAWKTIIPEGYKVKQSQAGTVWLYGKPGEEPMASPGIERVTWGFPGVWLVLPSGCAIEWEDLDSTFFAGEKHAFTCFLKDKETDTPVEIFSDWFDVPKAIR